MKISRFSIIMIVIIGICIALALALPVRKAVQSKNDRLLESGIYGVNSGIQQYYSTNNTLPKSLNDISVTDSDAKTIIANNMVEYRIVSNSVVPSTQKYDPDQLGATIYTQSSKKSAQYELCATYKFAKDVGYYESNDASVRTYPPSGHPAGRFCFTINTSY